MKVAVFYFFIVCIVFHLPLAQAEEPPPVDVQKEWIRLIAPIENAEVISKNPQIKAEFLELLNLSALVVLLDGTDITQMLNVTEKGFEYKSLIVLPSGMHNLHITATDKDGRELQKQISFTTRHSKTFQDAYINNEASIVYETVLIKPETSSVPNSKLEGNIRSDTKVKGKEWEFTFNTNIRFLDQSTPVLSPQKKGFNLANWILTNTYSKENLIFKTSIGDVMINETPYTVMNLARRGGSLNLQHDIYSLNLFSVKSEQVYGFKGGTGIGGSTDDNILGISGGVKLFDKKVEFKTIYVTGGEQGSSFGIWTAYGAKKGDVLSFLLTSNFFENKLTTEFEAGISRFDPDISDEFARKSDKAYRAKVGGFIGRFNYDAMYEYIGRDYAVVGSQMIQKDKEGLSFRGGANLDYHAINFMLSRYNDNVKGDELFPRIINYQGNLDYSFNKIPNLPIGIGYQKGMQESTKEPPGSTPIKLYTDTVTGRINYTKNEINIGFQTAYSLMNDRTLTNNDTTTITYTLAPSFSAADISVNPSFSLNQSKSRVTDVRTDTYTVNLDLRTKFFKERASFETGCTYSIAKADNGSSNSRILNANFRLAYQIKGFLKYFHKPSIALRGSYMKINDKVNPASNKDELTLFLVLATTIPFSF